MAQPDYGDMGGGGAPDMLGGVRDSIDHVIAILPALLVPVFALVTYFFLQWDRRRDGSPSKDDPQLGLKTALYALLASAVLLGATGATDLLAFILGGFKGGWKAMRGPLATVAVGGGAAFAVHALFLPRTNHHEKPQAERLATGMVLVILGGHTLVALDMFLSSLLAGDPWLRISAALAAVGVFGGVAVLALMRLGSLSGWRSIPKVPPMPMQPPMTGYPQQPPGQGGMPPLGGGYPPNSGGFPPQQGGGGWPPA